MCSKQLPEIPNINSKYTKTLQRRQLKWNIMLENWSIFNKIGSSKHKKVCMYIYMYAYVYIYIYLYIYLSVYVTFFSKNMNDIMYICILLV